MKRLYEKAVSINMCYFISETVVGGKVLYSIIESIESTCGRFREYDLNMYYSDFNDALRKIDSL